MQYLHSLILGAIQGITEFLPISSSAHLVLVPWIFGWNYQGLTYDVALHFGTLLAIVIFFWADWISIIEKAINPKANKANKLTSYNPKSYPSNLLWILLLATIPGAVAGALFEKQAETLFRSPLLIAIVLAVFGIILWLADFKPWQNPKSKVQMSNEIQSSKTIQQHNNITINKLGFIKALWIGLAQMLAIIPGVSRSGSTMAAGRLIGLNRPDSARFSFLLAAPIMFGAAVFELRHFSSAMITGPFILAFITSLVIGLLTIKYLLQYLAKGNFLVFAIYRVVLAIIIVVLYLMR